jgi:hypothetical protein
MFGRDPTEPALPEWIRNGYDILAEEYQSDTTELSKSEAQQLLLKSDHVETEGDAEYVIERLLQRGWLYEVEGNLRKTE